MRQLWHDIGELLGTSLVRTKDVNITIGAVASLILAFVVTSLILRLIRRFISRKLPPEDRNKFVSIFQFLQYLIYLFVLMFTLNASGVNVSVLLTASAAVFIGLGFALQQLFQDLIAGVLIILDQSLTVGDIIEVDGKVCQVERISLRSTKAVTRNQRVMIIPNHKFMNDTLFNWTQNSPIIRESVSVGVAYGSDTELVRRLLLQAVAEHEHVLENDPLVLFDDFADSSLNFSVFFFIDDAFSAMRIKSEIRFKIDRLFRENAVSIPFPQRDIHIIKSDH